MSEKITPNPHSPYADADPEYRHLIPSFFGLGVERGALAHTACGYMAVAPEQQELLALDFSNLPEGMCPKCVAEARGEPVEIGPAGQPHTCTACEMTTRHDGLCALCRQELHTEWMAQRGKAAG